jgi:hypothetical protein
MIIRPATLADLEDVVSIAIDQSLVWFPRLAAERVKISRTAVAAISSKQHFCWVAEDEGKVQGVLVGLTGDNLWASGQHTSIVLWVSKIPNGGAALLRRFKKWLQARKAIVLAGMTPDRDIDQRALRLLERIGFLRSGGSYLLFTRGETWDCSTR